MKVLKRVQSICPVCFKPVNAAYLEQSGQVFFDKTCSDCGHFSTLAASDVEDFLKWDSHAIINIPPKIAITKGANLKTAADKVGAADDAFADSGLPEPELTECPLHCGTCENHLQTACCIIINITKRCNQHCPYCFARADENDFSAPEPTVAEIAAKCDKLLEIGEERPFNIQLSGGEPTVREDLPDIIRLIKSKGFEYIQINSNGRRIAEEEDYAQKLKRAGASVIFMQFDGTADSIYVKLRGEPLLNIKKRAIINCRKAGLPVTIVPTIVRGVNLDNIGGMLQFLLYNVDVVKGIHFQPVSYFGRRPEMLSGAESCDALCSGLTYPERVTMFDVMHAIETQSPMFDFSDFCPINTGHPLCCFYSTYLKEGPGKVKCLISSKTKQQGISCCDISETGVYKSNVIDESRTEDDTRENTDTEKEKQREIMNGRDEFSVYNQLEDADALRIIKKDRDFVLKKWKLPEGLGTENLSRADTPKPEMLGYTDVSMTIDEFLNYYKSNTFTITGMAFQDASNLDAERLKRCRVQVMTEDDRLVPFCGYVSLDY